MKQKYRRKLSILVDHNQQRILPNIDQFLKLILGKGLNENFHFMKRGLNKNNFYQFLK